MKNLSLFVTGILLLLIGNWANAQSCDGNRFLNESFSTNLTTTNNITYGSNTGVNGQPQSLELHFYQPAGDTMAKRPLIIFVHGGSFIGGNKNDVTFLCERFAKMGYATATVEYRYGIFIPNQVTTTLAVMRCMHDIKAAVRFFRKDAATSNTYKIDPDKIIIGGVSAGSIGAIHAAYFNEGEIPPYMSNDTAGLGGIEGNSGNPGYSSDVIGVINYAGAIGDSAWIIPGDLPMVSFHYIGDQTVPYDTREVSVSGFPTGLTASGSGSIKTRTDNIGVVHDLKSYPGNLHADFLNNDLDSVIYRTKTFIYNNMTCAQPATSIATIKHDNGNFIVSPNPAQGMVNVDLKNFGMEISLKILDAQGKMVLHKTHLTGSQIQLDIKPLSSGLYFISLESKNGEGLGLQKLIVE